MKRLLDPTTAYGCSTKRSYGSFSDAKRVAKIQVRDTSDPVEPYLCPKCGRWHVGAGEPRATKLGKRKPKYEPTIEDNLAEWR